jgi:putative ABC transport system substrate-binding protein
MSFFLWHTHCGERLARMKRILIWVFVVLMAACVGLAEAQQPPKIARVGILLSGFPRSQPDRIKSFRQGLRELGYEEGRNIVIEEKSPTGGKLSRAVAELIQRNVHVILTSGTAATKAVKDATNTIPVVMTFVSDPVAFGFIASFARPGGNITGLTNFAPELGGKWLELLKEAFPKTSQVMVLMDRTASIQALLFEQMRAPAMALGIAVVSADVRTAKALEGASDAMKKRRPDALIVFPPPSPSDGGERILEFAAKNRLPAMYHWREYVDAGGLSFYGASLSDMYRRAATFVDKILKGANPAELPVEQPTKFEFVINLKTAKQIGLAIPPNVLARADRVIR